MTPRWQRREFLRRALIQLGAWPLLSALGCDDGDARNSAKTALTQHAGSPETLIAISTAVHEHVAQLQLGAQLDAYFGDGEARDIQHIGARYLTQVAPDGSDAQVLAAIEPTIRRIERHASDADAIAALQNAITTEFEAVDVVDLDGWTFAPTELALCALLWIAEQGMPARDGGERGGEDAGT